MIIATFAQTQPQLPEISNRDGLPTASTRRVIELPNGSVLVATDGGLHFAPQQQPILSQIKKTIGTQQCWDLQVVGNTLYVATYNQGLFLFDLQRGNVIQHFNHPNLKKIRRFRYVQGRLFCIAHYGVFEIIGNKLTLRLRTEHDLPEGNMPMDVFIRKQRLHVLNYPENLIVQQQPNGHWENWKTVLEKEGKNYQSVFYNNLSCFQTDSLLFIGGVNSYTVVGPDDQWTRYTLEAKQKESWAFWDFQIHRGKVYGAVSNTNDFNDGYLHLHEPTTTHYYPRHNQSLWSITPSKFRDAIWVSTETNGVHLAIQASQNQFAQTEYNTQVKATEHYIVRYSPTFLSIDFIPSSKDQSFNREQTRNLSCGDRIREVAEVNGQLYLMGAGFLWHYNPSQGELKKLIVSADFQWMHSRGELIWLFKPYNNVWIFNPRTNALKDAGFEAKADCVRKANNLFYYHIMGKGFAYIDAQGKQHTLRSNLPINQYTLNFEIVENQLIIEKGNGYDVYQINHQQNTLTYTHTLNLVGAFRDFPILQTLSSGKRLYLYSGNYLLEIGINKSKNPIVLGRQIYLGQWRIQGPVIRAGEHFVIDRGNSIQTVEFEATRNPRFEVQYSYKNEPQSFFRPFFAVNTEKNFRITVNGTRYFDQLRSIYTVDMVDVKTGKNQYGFFRGDAYYWINGIGHGKFNLAISLYDQWRSQFIIGTTEFYRDFPFWLMLVSLLTLLYWVFYNQVRTQESQQKRIATLQLKTLQSNFNPHFIYNSMSLIQSLIIGSETKKAIDVTARLAKLNRLFLSNSNKELIMLKDELDFIKEYVAMEKMRFESDTVFPFNINVNTRVKLTEWLIPPLIMQPLVENAIKHGVLVAKTAAEIVIDIQLINPSTIQIDIINTQANPTKKRNHGLGIGNQLVAERLAIFNELYPNQFEATFNYGFNDQKEYKSTIQIKQLDDKKSILSQKEVKAQILKPFETSNIEGGGK